jgi:hypothetical protein
MADTKISNAAGETGGPAETQDLTTTFLRKDGLYQSPLSAIPPVIPATPVGQVSSYSGAGGSSTAGGGGLHETLNAQGLYTLQGGVVPGSVIVAASTVANTSAETQLAGLTIPASDVVAGATYMLKLSGVYSDTGTPTLAWGLRYGGAAGTSIVANGATPTTLGSGVSNIPFQVEAVITFWTTTTATGYYTVDLGTNASTLATTRLTNSSGTSAVTVVSTSSKVLSLTVTFSAASASNTISAVTAYGMRLA